jgi:biopolymer transport protein ExbD
VGKKGKKHAKPGPVAKEDPSPEMPAPAPETPKPAIPQPEGIEFKVGGLPPCRSGAPILTPAAERLDITVAVSGAYKVGMNFADPDTVRAAIDSAEEARKKGGMLFLVPNVRSPWDAMKDVLNAGSGAGWARIGIAVAHPDNAGLGRVLVIRVPAGEAVLPKGTDAVTVKVGVGPAPVFVLNGEDCKDAATLEAKAKALHEEFELMTEGYAADVEKTPWTVDGTGAMVGGVVSAIDALQAAGVRTVRITGVMKPAAEGSAPAVPATDTPPVPGEEKK